MIQFTQDIDAWVKQIRSEFTEVKSTVGDINNVSEFIDEHKNNIQHNYELIKEMVDEIKSLKHEVSTLKAFKIMEIKEKMQKR